MFYRPGLDHHGLPHNPFKALITPRPIAWVASLDREGQGNLAPFSFFNAFGDEPPLVGLGISGGKGNSRQSKDTLTNILDTGEFTISLVPGAMLGPMSDSSAPLPRGADEFDACGLRRAPSHVVGPPRVAGCPAALECRFVTQVMLPSDHADLPQSAIFGQVVGIWIDEAILTDGRVDPTLYGPLARMGYQDYAEIRQVFRYARPAGGGDAPKGEAAG